MTPFDYTDVIHYICGTISGVLIVLSIFIIVTVLFWAYVFKYCVKDTMIINSKNINVKGSGAYEIKSTYNNN